MSDNLIDDLESKVIELLQRCQQLEQENNQLRNDQEHLLKANALTRSKVEMMIQRLKSLEQPS